MTAWFLNKCGLIRTNHVLPFKRQQPLSPTITYKYSTLGSLQYRLALMSYVWEQQPVFQIFANHLKCLKISNLVYQKYQINRNVFSIHHCNALSCHSHSVQEQTWHWELIQKIWQKLPLLLWSGAALELEWPAALHFCPVALLQRDQDSEEKNLAAKQSPSETVWCFPPHRPWVWRCCWCKGDGLLPALEMQCIHRGTTVERWDEE